MSNYGFVYILTNEYMPDVVKIGCTERSPHARSEELSRSSGVPAPFRVLCYAEVTDFQGFERKVHEWLGHHRVNENREFFDRSVLLYAVRILFHYQGTLSFAVVAHDEMHELLAASGDVCIERLADPWAPVVEDAKEGSTQLRVVQGGFDAA